MLSTFRIAGNLIIPSVTSMVSSHSTCLLGLNALLVEGHVITSQKRLAHCSQVHLIHLVSMVLQLLSSLSRHLPCNGQSRWLFLQGFIAFPSDVQASEAFPAARLDASTAVSAVPVSNSTSKSP